MTETVVGQLLSVNVGLPNDIAWHGETVHTAVWKRAVSGRRIVRRLNLDGDGQGDLIGHGGEQRAVLVYQIDCYRYWERELGRNDFDCGQFGENFTVEGLPDADVCIGDRYRIGSALFEVTQPRVTCYRVGIRMNEPRMAALLVAHGRPGFYFRVIEEGEVEVGDEIIKLASGAERMSVAEASALLYLPGHRREELQRALRIPALSAGWKGSFQALLEQAVDAGETSGNPGLAPADLSLSPPAWRGFRRVRVVAKVRESVDVISLAFEPADALPLAAPLAGQFIVLRMQPAGATSPLMRSYSLSGAPNAAQYRVSIKCEIAGAASDYLDRPRTRIHTETFGSGESRTPGIVNAHRRPVHSPAGPSGSGPLVSFARSDLSIRWHPKYQSLLELAEACDVPVRWSCRTGVCHTCETGLVDGAVDYQPDPLESPADGNLLICCSRPRSDVVIDL
jgi:MOSC domain-containing protein YiiM/ferredoxin